MRILSLGVPMPGAAIDNHNLANAPAFFDYDALVVDPASITTLAEEIAAGSAGYVTRGGVPIAIERDGGALALASLVRDRRHETERLLAQGGIVVCLAQPNACVAGIDRYGWLPAPEVAPRAGPEAPRSGAQRP